MLSAGAEYSKLESSDEPALSDATVGYVLRNIICRSSRVFSHRGVLTSTLRHRICTFVVSCPAPSPPRLHVWHERRRSPSRGFVKQGGCGWYDPETIEPVGNRRLRNPYGTPIVSPGTPSGYVSPTISQRLVFASSASASAVRRWAMRIPSGLCLGGGYARRILIVFVFVSPTSFVVLSLFDEVASRRLDGGDDHWYPGRVAATRTITEEVTNHWCGHRLAAPTQPALR